MAKQASAATAQETSTSSVIAITTYVLIGALPFSMLIFLPMFVGAMVTELGFTDQQAGFVASADSAGFALAALPAIYWIPKLNTRTFVLYGLIGLLVFNVASDFITSPNAMIALRFLAGFAAGTVSAGIVASIACTHDPDRVFGLWMAGQLGYGTIGYLLIPSAFEQWGIGAGFIGMALLSAAVLPLVRWVPTRPKAAQAGKVSDQTVSTRRPLWGVLSILAFYIGLNVVWAFLERVGDVAGLSIETIGNSLAVANFAGLVAAVVVSILSTKLGRIAPLSLGLIITSAAILLLLGDFDANTYTLSTSVYLAGWCFLVPLMLGAIAQADSTGRYLALGNAAVGIGLTSGAALGALLVVGGDYTRVIWAGAICVFASLVLILPLLRGNPAAADETPDTV